MSVTLKWIGLKELREALTHLPEELTDLSVGIVAGAAEAAAAEIKAAYPEGDTGNLRKGVRVKNEDGRLTVRRVVRSAAPHATLFETGTVVRSNKRGQNRGFMPGANIFVPVVMRHRREQDEDLVAVVEQAGLDVRR